MPSLTIPDVPAAVVERLEQQARAAGQPLDRYLAERLGEWAGRNGLGPTALDRWLDRLDVTVTSEFGIGDVLDAIDADRQERFEA